MKLQEQHPKQSLNKAYLKEKVSRDHIELFKKNLTTLSGRINEEESEEHLKNVIADFLKDTWYKDLHEINTKDRNDLVIHTGKTSREPVGVILEVKKPSNKTEMISASKPNFDVRNYDSILRNEDKKDDSRLIALYKILSPVHLLKQPFSNDSNSLDTGFYTELLQV